MYHSPSLTLGVGIDLKKNSIKNTTTCKKKRLLLWVPVPLVGVDGAHDEVVQLLVLLLDAVLDPLAGDAPLLRVMLRAAGGPRRRRKGSARQPPWVKQRGGGGWVG